MSTHLLFLHLLLTGLWIGCVATEVVFERLLIREPAHHALLARLHRLVDLWVELPVFVFVALTGGWLWWHQPGGLDGGLLAKMVFGGVAVLANLVCVPVVILRDRAAAIGDAVRFARLDRLQHRLGALVVVGMVGAVGVGLARVAGG